MLLPVVAGIGRPGGGEKRRRGGGRMDEIVGIQLVRIGDREQSPLPNEGKKAKRKYVERFLPPFVRHRERKIEKAIGYLSFK